MTDLTIQPTTATKSPKLKESPSQKVLGTAFNYSHSSDGTDENLLIFFHGLGDAHIPFTKLGRSFNLPQTAILSLRAPELVPFLYEEAYQWYPSFDSLGDLLSRPNPTTCLQWLIKVISHLVEDSHWPPESIHLFGFAQGGTVASELGLKFWRTSSQESNDSGSTKSLGSIVSIAGPLLSYPTLSQSSRCPTPVLFYHPSSSSQDDVRAFEKGFTSVRDIKMPSSGEEETGRMPRNKIEWYPVMKFWSELMGRREMILDGAYEVIR